MPLVEPVTMAGFAASEFLAEAQPTRQFVTPAEIGGLAAFLCSDGARSITGAALPIDGGWTGRWASCGNRRLHAITGSHRNVKQPSFQFASQLTHSFKRCCNRSVTSTKESDMPRAKSVPLRASESAI